MEVGTNADVDTEPGDELKARLNALSAKIEASTILVKELRMSKQALPEERRQSRQEGKAPPSSLPRQDSHTDYIRPGILISLMAVMAFMLLQLCISAYSLSADRCIASAPRVVLAPAAQKINLDAVPSKVLYTWRIPTEAKSQDTSITVPSETHISQPDNSPCSTPSPTCTCSHQTPSPKSQQSKTYPATTYPATTYPATTYLNPLPPSNHEKTTTVHPSICIEELVPVRHGGRLQIRPERRCTLPTTIVVG
ncbi:MAG: hypothetical protein M1835_000388 [Candelina submexicana]|nr:MAG: hypothetical protein M1835_000388 [Candelina submexicana]